MPNRRNFIRNSFLAVSGAGLAGRTTPEVPVVLVPGKDRKFVFRTLGKSGIRIPVISMGTGNCNNPALINEAYEQGVKFFVTHSSYKNGNNEIMVGNALKDKPRDSFMVMTGATGGLSIDFKNGLYKPDTDADKYLESINGCLERMQVDYLDILCLGSGARRESVFYEPILKAMETAKKQGKAKYLCLGTHKFEPEAIRATVDTGVYDMVMPAYNFLRENKEETRKAMQYAADKGLGIIAMKTMAGAYWDKEKTQPINTRAALKWVVQNENVHTTVPDCASFDHLYQDLDIMADMELTESEKNDLQPPAGMASSGLFCEQCGKCLAQCTGNIDIPTLMRSYMYAYGYRNLNQARKTFDHAGLAEDACRNCADCLVKCRVGFDVKEKIADITRIRDIPEDMILHS